MYIHMQAVRSTACACELCVRVHMCTLRVPLNFLQGWSDKHTCRLCIYTNATDGPVFSLSITL